MASIEIRHQAIANSWIKPEDLGDIKTLVLGSFNPHNPKDNNSNLDYYYGRKENYFWQTIASINQNKPAVYFTDPNLSLEERLDRKISVMKNCFACLDVIDSITMEHQSLEILETFVRDNVFTNFLDQTIWTSQKSKEPTIRASRVYNQSILDFLKVSTTVKSVIHTMGKDRINANSIKPRELRLGDAGFEHFMKQIWKICEERNILFELVSQSPSRYAVHRAGIEMPLENLRIQYTTYLLNH